MRFVHNPRGSARHHDAYPDESPPALAQSKGPFLSQFIQGRRAKKMAASAGLPRSPSPHKTGRVPYKTPPPAQPPRAATRSPIRHPAPAAVPYRTVRGEGTPCGAVFDPRLNAQVSSDNDVLLSQHKVNEARSQLLTRELEELRSNMGPPPLGPPLLGPSPSSPVPPAIAAAAAAAHAGAFVVGGGHPPMLSPVAMASRSRSGSPSGRSASPVLLRPYGPPGALQFEADPWGPSAPSTTRTVYSSSVTPRDVRPWDYPSTYHPGIYPPLMQGGIPLRPVVVIRELDENDMGSSSTKQNDSPKAPTSERDRELELLKHAHAMSELESKHRLAAHQLALEEARLMRGPVRTSQSVGLRRQPQMQMPNATYADTEHTFNQMWGPTENQAESLRSTIDNHN